MPKTHPKARKILDEIDPSLFDDLSRKCLLLFKEKIHKITPLKGGMNNKAFKVVTDGNTLLLKLYAKDERNRLDREFNAYSFLRKNDIRSVPKAYFKNNELNYGIYSFEEGKIKKSEEISRRDLRKMADFIIKLQSLYPKYDTFPGAVKATFSFDEFAERINKRLEHFIENSKNQKLNPKVKSYAEKSDIINFIKSKTKELLKNVKNSGVKLSLDPQEHRLSSADFGPHNIIFKSDGEEIFFDFEYFGWDDPANIIGMFITDEKARGISEIDKKYFIEYYKKRSTLPKRIIERLDLMIKAFEIDWMALILDSLAPERLKHYITSGNLKEDVFVENQIDKLQMRMKFFN